MNLSDKVPGDKKDSKFESLKKATTLNPNAAAFVPLSLKVTYGSTKNSVATRLDVAGSSNSALLDRSVSNTSNNSDDEIQYWKHQLPDDITPDFKIMGAEIDELEDLSLPKLSLHANLETSGLHSSVTNQIWGRRQDMTATVGDRFSSTEKLGYSGSSLSELQSSASFTPSSMNSWGKTFIPGEPHYSNGGEENLYNGDYNASLVNNLLGESAAELENSNLNPIDFLSSQFPGFATQSLADVYYGNGCDLNLTLEILTQLELQVDVSFDHNHNAKPLVAASLNLLDFPALPTSDSSNGLSKYSGEDVQFFSNTLRSPSMLKAGADFASTVKKLASQDSGHWRYDRDSKTVGTGAGPSRNSQFLDSSYNVYGKMANGNKLQGAGGGRAGPLWLETGEAVGNMYSELREEARDFACLRNAYFEQARQAYLIGNKALAKDLSVKGQLYNMQMKAAHEKAKDTIYRQRNPLSSELHGYSRGQDPLIDLHGLHVSEALHVLNQELNMLKRTVRSTGQHLRVMICVGTGHHTKGSRNPARLPVAVEQYLLEEGLHFTQPQPGLLLVVM